MADKVNREDEIAAPLKVIAEISNDAAIKSDLESVIRRRAAQPTMADEELALREAIKNIVASGRDYISATQVINEMAILLGADFGQTSTTEVPSWRQPAVIGRKLRDQWVDGDRCERPYVAFGVRLRSFALLPDRKSEIEKELLAEGRTIGPSQKPGTFCVSCEKCRYRSFCEIRSDKAQTIK